MDHKGKFKSVIFNLETVPENNLTLNSLQVRYHIIYKNILTLSCMGFLRLAGHGGGAESAPLNVTSVIISVIKPNLVE